MKISELFSQLSYGELSNLSIGNDGSGAISSEHYAKITHHTQKVLTNLYSRFMHKKDYYVLKLDESITKYMIDPLYAVSDTTPLNTKPRYIIDTVEEPFDQKIIKVMSVHLINEDTTLATEGILLNDDSREGSIKTLTYNQLYIREPVQDQLLMIGVQLNHPVIPQPVDLEYEIILAPVLEEALIAKVASRIYGSMNGQENLIKSQSLNAEYEAILQIVQFEDLLQTSSTEDHYRFVLGGWQ